MEGQPNQQVWLRNQYGIQKNCLEWLQEVWLQKTDNAALQSWGVVEEGQVGGELGSLS